MHVLLINAFAEHDPGRVLADAAVETLVGRGHTVRRRDLVESEFNPFMSPAERLAYHLDQPLIDEETAEGAACVRWAHGLLFTYPTAAGTVPAVLKGWLDRVLVPGVAFVFDEAGRVAPGMRNIVRLGAVTVQTDRRLRVDGGRRTIMRTIRLNCARGCRRTWIPVAAPDVALSSPVVARRLARW